MKTKKTLTTIALACAALVAPLAARALTGDIVDIRVVDTDDMVFGDRNSLAPNLCKASNPLVAGAELYVRVRMLVTNHVYVANGVQEPQTWYFASGALGASALYTPKLGLWIGNRVAYAEYSDYGPKAWQKSGALETDDAGNVDPAWGGKAPWRYYTDFYFRYKVRAGDLGLPVKLSNSTGTGPASNSDVNSSYCLLYCNSDGTDHYVLQNSNGDVAKFWYGPAVSEAREWPDGIAGDNPIRNFDLSAEGAFVKTIDFDNVNADGGSYSDGQVWRNVYPGMSAAPGTMPTLLVGGGATPEATLVYVWSADENVMVPVASGANTVSSEGGKTVLTVPVPAGVSSVTFSMKGADGAVAGTNTVVYMSPVKGNVTRPSGELVDVAVSRKVEVIAAPEPTVEIFLDGSSATKTVTAKADYITCETQLAVRMTPACDEPVTVSLGALVSGDDTMTSLADLYAADIIRIAEGGYGGDPIDQKLTNVTISANTSVVYLNLYVLGGTAKTSNKGITFSTTKISGPDKVTTKGACTLKIRPSTPVIVDSDPAFSTDSSPSTVTVVSGGSTTFALTIEDAYRDLYDTATGYTFKWACDGEEIDDDVGVVMDDGRFIGSAKFYNITDGKELTLCVVNPDGKTSAKVKYNLVVTDSKKTTVAFTDPTRLVFAEGESTYVNLGLSQPYRGTGYIFIGADDTGDLACITTALTSAGAQIPQGQTTVATPRQIRFLDGDRDVTLKAILCSANNPANTVSTYVAGTLSFTITNAPPQVTSVTAAGQYLTPDMNGQTIESVSRGVVKSFSLVASDVEADLKAAGDDAMAVKWEIDGATYYTYGDPSTNSVKHTFANVKPKAQVRVYVKDKDMAAYPTTPNFMFYVPVTDKPGVLIDTNAEGGIFNETDSGVAQISVKLSEPASSNIVVRFTVSKPSDGGYLRVRTVDGSVTNVYNDVSGEPVLDPNAYDLVFTTGATDKILIVSEMDGTDDTLAGVDLNAKVISETENQDGVKWSDFYTAAEPRTVRVQNVAPEILRPTEAEEAYTNMNASVNTPYPIVYACKDVPADMTNSWKDANNVTQVGMLVSILIDGTEVFSTNVTDRASRTYSAEFEGEGAHAVEVSFTDKDGMTSRRTINYYVQPSKTLELRAHGPAWAIGTSGGYSQHYGGAPGLGAGRVFAGASGPQKVENFAHTYSFGIKEMSVSAYGFGYKADGKYDDGTMTPTPDKEIDKNGNWSKGTTILAGDHYNYTAQHPWGIRGYDSFLYAWACNNTESTSTSGGDNGDTSMSIVFNMGESGETKIPMPDSNQSGSSSSSSANDKSYPKQYWEAVFSREYLKADNCGDINQDGVPDVIVARYGMGIFDPVTGKLQTSQGGQGTASEGDLTDLKDYNKDLDKNGGEWPDFLPSQEASIYGSLIPGLSGTWVTDGREFGARLEIRGYHDGLNDAMTQLGFGNVKSDLVYAKAVDDGSGNVTWQWTPDCTISELEFYAWTEYAAVHGLEWTNATHWAEWSPERPTSPVKCDTDGDGFTDGYEYYFWYKAHVGYWAYDSKGNRIHRRLTGRRYNPRNPGDGVLITSEEIESLMDPQVATDSAGVMTRDTDSDGLPDLLEFEIGTNPFDFDTDGDGLPDGWELTLAGLNPLLAYTSADLIHDSVRNYDGDAMAITSFKLEKAEKPTIKHPEVVQYTTFAVLDPNGDTDGVQWYATKAEVALATNSVSMWAFKLADGTAVVSLAQPRVTEDGRLANTLARGVAFSASSAEVVDDSDPANVVTNEVPVRGWPLYVAAGTPVVAASVADSATNVAVLAVGAAIDAKDANAAWVYGKDMGDDPVDTTVGEVAASAADYGCLALGRNLAVKAGAELCAVPSDERDVALLHYLVYQQFGFDPRTAWRAVTPLANRWGATANGEAVEGVASSYCAHPARTRDFATYDEFLVYSFFVNNGCEMSGFYSTRYSGAPGWTITWSMFTTNPQGPNEPDNIQLEPPADALGAVGWTQYFFGRDDADNGADTDGDGVPDGWELYVMAGQKDKDAFVFAPPYAGFKPATASEEMKDSALSPFQPLAKSTYTSNQLYVGSDNNDNMNEFQEFESTDAMNHYVNFSQTVVHDVATDGEWKWFNKFFPTDPWNRDTDGDGLFDDKEKSNFIYGTPVDHGARSIVGGGLNPNSVDTDGDGLPDQWEVQFKGKTPFPGNLAQAIAAKGEVSKDAAGNEGNYLQGLIDGMDGTVKDAFSYPIVYDTNENGSSNVVRWTVVGGVSQIVNRDYDNDGLENWQEYMTGMMRCWRYDDPVSQWIPIPKDAYFDATGAFNPDFAKLNSLFGVNVANMDEFWYATLVNIESPIYNPRLVTDVSSGAQYLSRVKNVWDPAYIDSSVDKRANGAYYWFRNIANEVKIRDFWINKLPLKVGWLAEPSKYICCSPIEADSDQDGMDDYYELFHGMNPLLGKSGVTKDTGGPCDLVYDAWANEEGDALEAWGEGDRQNYWQRNPWKTPRGNTYDFEVFPWLNGAADADPDGDGVLNQTEAIIPKIATWEMHTDPTPLWMTDSSYDYSFVNRFFRMPTRFESVYPGDTFVGGDEVYYFKDFDGWVPPAMFDPAHFGSFAPDWWNLSKATESNWMYSFEENDGFDSDHDGISDTEEKQGKFGGATDPQQVDSPRRRQAMYFQGPDRPSALQTMPELKELHPVGKTLYPDDMSFSTYTVECWARPEALDDSVIVERAVWIGLGHPADEEYMRKNFLLGIKNGRWYTKFDNNGTTADKPVELVSSIPASAAKWTHLAATYDGSELVLYVDGVADARISSSLQPAYGSAAVAVNAGQSYWFDLEHELKAVIVGASAKTQAEGTPDGKALDVTQGLGWDRYTKYFKGWVDEIRVWDGARTAAEIAEAMTTRMTPELAAKNRSTFYEQWSMGKRRYAKDESGNPHEMTAELRYHWAFDSVFGADNENVVAIAPHGFGDRRAVLSRPDGYQIPWWATVLAGYTGTVYADPAWVCWIPNTVAHLPRFDGTTLDSVYWSDDFMGNRSGTYRFSRVAEPVSFWTQMTYNRITTDLEYHSTGSRHLLVNTLSSIAGSDQSGLFEFTGRHLNQSGDDMVALGGAYVKTVDNDVGLWDGQGAGSNWEITGGDADNDGLPDWWEQYADENYRPAGMDPAEEIGWSTVISWNGLSITAGEAYLRDLARGAYQNSIGEIVQNSTKYEQRADADASGIPDWWEDLYGVRGESGLADHDHDGLPNYVEYLLSEVFRFDGIMFDPTNPRSVDQYTLDYFYRVGSLYVGEIFTDHDQVEDEWEDEYKTLDDGVTPFASRLAYDASADVDEDGWSNRSEVRYSKSSMPIVANAQTHYTAADGLVADYPVPTLALTLRYNGVRQNSVNTAPIVVQIRRSGTYRQPDAEYSIGVVADASAGTGQDSTKTAVGSTSYTRTLGKWADRHLLGTLTPGNVALNSLVFEYCYDPSSIIYTWEVRFIGFSGTEWYEMKRGTRSEYDYDKRKYGDYNINLVSMDDSYATLDGLELRTDETGSVATWVHNDTGFELGTVNLKTGAFDINLGVFKGRLVVNSSNSTERASLEDQTFRIRYATNPSVGLPRKLYLGYADNGYVREGKNDIVAFADVNASGAFDEGEPYGIVQGVDISWKGTSAEIELTDLSPVTPRFDVFAAGTMLVATTNIAESSESSSGGSSGGNSSSEVTEPTRVRVVRWKVDDVPIYGLGGVESRVVLDKVLDPRVTTTLTEEDFLDENVHDIDWDNFYNDLTDNDAVLAGNYKLVKADYLVFFGDGDVSWSSRFETNKWLAASSRVITRYFGANRVKPVPVALPTAGAMGVVNTANPTFAWTMDCPDREAYTAFRIQVLTGPSTVVYDSGVRRAPVKDADGVYRWAAPLYAGDMTTSGTVFANKSYYWWRVTMYNAKFRDNVWSDVAPTFYVDAQAKGGTASVDVRYFGPAESYGGKVVRVQAFVSPDFTGIPVAAGYVANTATLSATGAPMAENCSIIGLPEGKYYLKAFIDSNNNGVCDGWETSGYLCARDGTTADWLSPKAITVGPDVGVSEIAEIYLDDADTDNDDLPDAWEYAMYGSLTAKGVELVSKTPAGEALVNTQLSGALELRENAQTPAAGLATHVRSKLGNAGTLALALGVDTQGYDTFAAAISGSVSEKLAENGVKIKSLELVDGKVRITLDVETKPGEVSNSVLVAEPESTGIEVVAKVYWKQSLSDEWTLRKSQSIFAGRGEETIDAGDVGDGSSGFYKVEVSEK